MKRRCDKCGEYGEENEMLHRSYADASGNTQRDWFHKKCPDEVVRRLIIRLHVTVRQHHPFDMQKFKNEVEEGIKKRGYFLWQSPMKVEAPFVKEIIDHTKKWKKNRMES